MKTRLVLCIALVSLCLCISAGQEKGTRVGIGISLNPTALISSSSSSTMFLPVGLTNIYVPIDGAKNFRFEPEAGLYSSSYESSSGSSSSRSSASIIRLGVGLFYRSTIDDGFVAYVGPRFGVLLTSSSSEGSSGSSRETSESDYFVGLAVGGEYALSTHFSLGGEAQLNYISFGQPDISPAPTSSSTRSQSLITNNALMFFRWYF